MQFDNPLLLDKPDICTPEQVLFGLYICRTRFAADGATAVMDGNQYGPILEDWRGILGIDWDYHYAAKLFSVHRTNYMRFPKQWIRKGLTKPSGIPLPFKLAAATWRRFPGMTEADAWDMGLNRLACYRCDAMESEGVDAVNERTLERLEELEAAVDG